jgi:hypothetical protein
LAGAGIDLGIAVEEREPVCEAAREVEERAGLRLEFRVWPGLWESETRNPIRDI